MTIYLIIVSCVSICRQIKWAPTVASFEWAFNHLNYTTSFQQYITFFKVIGYEIYTVYLNISNGSWIRLHLRCRFLPCLFLRFFYFLTITKISLADFSTFKQAKNTDDSSCTRFLTNQIQFSQFMESFKLIFLFSGPAQTLRHLPVTHNLPVFTY